MPYVPFAKEKSEYSYCLLRFINLKLKPKERYTCFRRMQEIEEFLKEKGDEIAIIISTKNSCFDFAITAMEKEKWEA